jgi:hypothetical protein
MLLNADTLQSWLGHRGRAFFVNIILLIIGWIVAGLIGLRILAFFAFYFGMLCYFPIMVVRGWIRVLRTPRHPQRGFDVVMTSTVSD